MSVLHYFTSNKISGHFSNWTQPQTLMVGVKAVIVYLCQSEYPTMCTPWHTYGTPMAHLW